VTDTRLPGKALGTWLHANVVFPGVVRLRGEGELFAALGELRAVERMPAEQVARRQSRRLAQTIEYAASHSPYYRSRWPGLERVGPAEAADFLAGLPCVTKTDLREHVEEMRARPGPRRVTRKITGGSTGQAVTVYKDRAAIAREMAASWLGYGWFGVRIGDRAARFWGSPHSLKRRLRFAAADFAMHRVRFSAFAFDEADLEAYWKRCLGFRPRYLYGYVSMLEEFAKYLRRTGHDGRVLGLKAVITTSEVLSPPQRQLLEEVFGAPVQNEYGCGEVGPIAYECEHGSLHVMSENLHVELLGPDGTPARAPGESGEVVVTDLNNRAMPLVRYRLGDFGTWGGACTCGRGFPVLEKVWGRAYDFVQLPSGRRCHGEYFMYLFEDLRGGGVDIEQFQVVQPAERKLDVAIVLKASSGEGVEQRVRAALEERAQGMEVTVRRVPAIQRAASGKMRVILNPWLNPDAPARPAASPGLLAASTP
jgi:phenylacetate-CoA ligase